MGKITIASLQDRKDHLVLGDVCYFATPQYTSRSFENYVSLLQNQEVTSLIRERHAMEIKNKDQVPFIIFVLTCEYRSFREDHNEEPKWINSLPGKLRKYLRQDFLPTDPRIDAIMFPRLPYSGFGYHVLRGGITDRVFEAFDLHRLSGILQLGFLHQPIAMSESGRVLTLPFSHTREIHIFDVRAVGKLILANSDSTEDEHTLFDIAALSHDARTPAGGDSTKSIDPKAFDEDVHYPKVLAQANLKLLPEISEADKGRLIQIILNRGKLGAVLDVADKIAYISRDTSHFLVPNSFVGAGVKVVPSWGTIEEAELLTSVWETVCIDGDKVYFSDPDRLVQFLEHRARMFKELYQNPFARFWEQFVKIFVLEKFYKTGRVTEDQLLQMQDWELKNFIQKEIGENILDYLAGNMEERREGFHDLAQAQARQAQLREQGRVVCIIEKAFPVKAGTHFLVQTKAGLKTLKQADPATAAHIHALAQPEVPFNLYYLDLPVERLPASLRNWV